MRPNIDTALTQFYELLGLSLFSQQHLLLCKHDKHAASITIAKSRELLWTLESPVISLKPIINSKELVSLPTVFFFFLDSW